MSSKKKLSRNAAVSDTKVFPQLCIINIINLEISNLYLTSYLKLQDITTLPHLFGWDPHHVIYGIYSMPLFNGSAKLSSTKLDRIQS